MRPTPFLTLSAVAALLASAATALAGSGAVVWEPRIEVDSGQAYQGPWRMNASRFLYVDDPTVAIDDAGNIAVAWVDNEAKEVLVQVFALDGRARLRTPANVSRSPDTFSWLPRVVFDQGEGQGISVLWQEIIFSGGSHGGEILFARSTDGGRTFSQPLNLSNTTAGAGKGRLTAHYWHNGSLDLAAGAGGRLYAVWTDYEGGLWLSRSTDGGERFSRPVRVAGDDSRPARGPTLALDADENLHLAWTIGEDAAADIRYARSLDRGRSFEAARAIGAGGGHADAPKLVVDRHGTVHLTYAESAAGPLRRYHIRHARSDDGGATFSAPRPISSNPPPGFESAHFPHFAADASGYLYLAWELFADARQRPTALAFALSTDGGRTFSTPEVVPGTHADLPNAINGSLQGLLMSKLAVNDAGQIALVNSTFAGGRSSHVRLHRGGIDAELVPAAGTRP